jgi:outer membrane receptor protein involved in Fe transport
MLGSVIQAEFTTDLATWLPQWNTHSLYFQTDWRATPKLTLNLGLRWQYESPFTTRHSSRNLIPTSLAHSTAGGVR